MNFFQANRIAPDGTPHSAASHLGLYCLPMSHKNDASLIQVQELTIQVLESLKMAALCNADITAITACRLLSSSNF